MGQRPATNRPDRPYRPYRVSPRLSPFRPLGPTKRENPNQNARRDGQLPSGTPPRDAAADAPLAKLVHDLASIAFPAFGFRPGRRAHPYYLPVVPAPHRPGGVDRDEPEFPRSTRLGNVVGIRVSVILLLLPPVARPRSMTPPPHGFRQRPISAMRVDVRRGDQADNDAHETGCADASAGDATAMSAGRGDDGRAERRRGVDRSECRRLGVSASSRHLAGQESARGIKSRPPHRARLRPATPAVAHRVRVSGLRPGCPQTGPNRTIRPGLGFRTSRVSPPASRLSRPADPARCAEIIRLPDPTSAPSVREMHR